MGKKMFYHPSMVNLWVKIVIFAVFFSGVSFGSHRDTEVVKAVRTIKDSVINIRTEQIIKRNFNPLFDDPFFNDFFGLQKSYKTQSIGSGFFISSDGTAVTNYHVIESASKIFVITSDGNQYEAELVAGDKLLDIAVIKINSPGEIQTAKLGISNDIMLGETVIAMGNPYGLESSLTTGVVSNINRIINSEEQFSRFIQIDAPINPGNSGGPLVNLDGEVIGINSAIYKQAQGIGFSIPIDTLKRILPDLLKYKKIRRSYTGFEIEETQNGVTVSALEKSSGAENLGIKNGDIIYKLGGVVVPSKMAFSYIMRSYPPGSDIEIVLKRDKKFLKGNLKTLKFPDNFGINLLKQRYGLDVTEKDKHIYVKKSSIPAYIKPGDFVIEINSQEINNTKDLNNIILENLYEKLIFSIFRNGRIFKIEVSF